MFILINNLDSTLTNVLNSLLPHNQFLDLFFTFFSLKGNSIFIWVVIIVAVLIFEERKNPGIQKKDIKFVLYFLISLGVTAILVNFVLKNTFHRPRPCSPTNLNKFQQISTNIICPSDFSFPSGHASTSFAAATIISAFNKKRKWFYYFIAILISYSRLYLGVHYFFDILGGAVLGYLISKTLEVQLPKFLHY